jgi:hypothetical protein
VRPPMGGINYTFRFSCAETKIYYSDDL